MSMDQYVRAIAGAFVVISVTLGYFHHPYWLGFTVFVGLNLFQSAFTKFCPLENILSKLNIVKR